MKRLIRKATPVEMLDAFESKLTELNSEKVDSCNSVQASLFNEYSNEWVKLESKPVYDFDGFLTEYSLWRNTITGEYACFFGDTEIYDPNLGNVEPDAEFDSENEAYDWYYDYDTEDEEDIYDGDIL